MWPLSGELLMKSATIRLCVVFTTSKESTCTTALNRSGELDFRVVKNSSEQA